jgi:predicted TIM-barrel fold metal-dependent hydrolase
MSPAVISSVTSRGIIDADIHPYVRGGLSTLIKYMPRGVRHKFVHGDGGGADGLVDEAKVMGQWNPPNRYTNPHVGVKVGVLRADATPPDGGLPGSDPEYVVKDLLDPYHVKAGVLLPVASAGGGHVESVSAFTDAEAGAAYVGAVNDYFLENWLPVDRRFAIALQLLTRDPERSIREIRRHQGKRGVVACFLPLTNHLMGDRYYHPIYKVAEEYDLPLVIHPFGAEGNFMGGPTLAGGVPATYLERHVALSQVGQANVASLVLSGTFEMFPRLRLVVAEFGFTWAAPLMMRMDRDWKRLKAEVPNLRKAPSEYVAERVRFTTQPMEETDTPGQLATLLEIMQAERTLLFSSDYPHWDNDHPETTLAALPRELQRRIYHDNALETFGPRLTEMVARAA